MRVALLNDQNVFVGMVDVAEAELTDRHLPQIKACDLEPGKYRWIAHDRNEYGGEFESIDYAAAIEKTRQEALQPRPAERRRRGRT